jgi:hypothetical protein
MQKWRGWMAISKVSAEKKGEAVKMALRSSEPMSVTAGVAPANIA